MSLDDMNKCPICDGELKYSSKTDDSYVYFFDCHSCGHYAINIDFYADNIEKQKTNIGESEIASYLYYNNDERIPFPYLCNKDSNEISKHSKITIDEVNSWYPKTFNDKIDLFLLMLEKKMSFYGEPTLFTDEQLYSACFVNKNPQGFFASSSGVFDEQANYFLNYLEKQNLIQIYHNTVSLQPKGLERLDGIQKNLKNISKNVFVSMSFSDNTLLTREALREAITDAKFSPAFIDEIIHNKQIVPEMFRLIRECRFLILEISDPNYGAYYEAGYALGLGKEVIICCSEEVFYRKYETDDEKKHEKYLKPHFDIAQKQILLWKDYSDLRKKLAEWIKALFN